MAVLASPLRFEIMDSLLAYGPASVPELTVRLGAPGKTLYYHMRQLHEAGLVRVQEVRRVGKRDESVYGTTDAPLKMAPGTDAVYREHMIRSVSAVLRLVDREHQKAVHAIAAKQASKDRLWVFRSVFQLDPEARTQFLVLLDQARQFAQEHHTPGHGTLLSFSAFAVPLQPHSDLPVSETNNSDK
jgi:predicted ArsR family transcriptional regulator